MNNKVLYSVSAMLVLMMAAAVSGQEADLEEVVILGDEEGNYDVVVSGRGLDLDDDSDDADDDYLPELEDSDIDGEVAPRYGRYLRYNHYNLRRRGNHHGSYHGNHHGYHHGHHHGHHGGRRCRRCYRCGYHCPRWCNYYCRRHY